MVVVANFKRVCFKDCTVYSDIIHWGNAIVWSCDTLMMIILTITNSAQSGASYGSAHSPHYM